MSKLDRSILINISIESNIYRLTTFYSKSSNEIQLNIEYLELDNVDISHKIIRNLNE